MLNAICCTHHILGYGVVNISNRFFPPTLCGMNILGLILASFVFIFVDVFCSIRIIDESYPSPGIAVNFFAETMDKLPEVLTVGDILQISQVVVTIFAQIFACCLLGVKDS